MSVCLQLELCHLFDLICNFKLSLQFASFTHPHTHTYLSINWCSCVCVRVACIKTCRNIELTYFPAHTYTYLLKLYTHMCIYVYIDKHTHILTVAKSALTLAQAAYISRKHNRKLIQNFERILFHSLANFSYCWPIPIALAKCLLTNCSRYALPLISMPAELNSAQLRSGQLSSAQLRFSGILRCIPWSIICHLS